MASHPNTTSPIPAYYVHKLVCHLFQKPPDVVKKYYINALQMLDTNIPCSENDEFKVFEEIKLKLVKQEKIKEVCLFTDLYRRLQASTVLKNRGSVLHLLYCLANVENTSNALETELATHTNDVKSVNNLQPKNINFDEVKKGQLKDVASPSSPLSKNKQTFNQTQSGFQSRVSRVASLFSNPSDQQQLVTWSTMKKDNCENSTVRSEETNLGSIALTIPSLRSLLRDILYAVQGLKGEIIYFEPEKNDFTVVFKAELSNPVKRLTLRFVEMGWLYYRINLYCKFQSNETTLGLIGQSFVAALKAKLTEYYKLIAQLEAFLNQDATLQHLYNNANGLTLHRMSVWFFEPHLQLKILASLVDACKNKKGGALASVLYSHLQHGDSFIQQLIQNLLRIVTRPLFKMLSNWIYCGELEDAYGEFFVASNLAVPDISLWQEKYHLNKAMIPSFISMDQARKILSTGKAINFLRQVCHDDTFTRDEARHKKVLELMNPESLFSHDATFEIILEKNYEKTSKSVLKVLHSEYSLMDHLLAMRNYFLLGQGDFIRHLMDLIDLDLAKPANMLYIHNLSGILESAIRATNAQFHNPEVLQRLDVRLLEVSLGDTGWDVFSLDYHVDGPIGTVFTPQCMNSYLRLFTTLWRAKRMEYILSKISQSRTTYLNLQDKIPEVTPILHQCHIILAQMVHFVQQMQYYMAFEVMECCWADLLLKMSSAQDLDQVIAAHENFLDTLLTRALLDEESSALRSQLKAIYDLIIQFHKIQETFWNKVEQIVEKLGEKEDNILLNTEKGFWGITEKYNKAYEISLASLTQTIIPKTKVDLRLLSHSYEDMVQKFLIMLNENDDPNLRFLSFRLDFNEHFKNKNSRLQTSLTYQHRRRSFK